jgi:hypothetical protein
MEFTMLKKRIYWIITLVVGIFSITFTTCNNEGDNAHLHDWQWVITATVTQTTDGIETETCTKCGETKSTRIYAHYTGNLTDDCYELIYNEDNIAIAYRIVRGNAIPLSEVHIPAYRLYVYNGLYLPITEIGRKNGSDYGNNIAVFYGRNSLKTIFIPDTVLVINNWAFGNSGLTNVIFSNNSQLESIGYAAFIQCSYLPSITIPETVKNIGSFAFHSCANLNNVTIPASITSIEDGAFYGTTNLIKITFEGTINPTNLSYGYYFTDQGGTQFIYTFLGDLREKYIIGGPGVYTRLYGSNIWNKQH